MEKYFPVYLKTDIISYYHEGSSPRLWGTLTARSSVSSIVRFMPTPVGNTPAQYIIAGQGLVHPHACGEHRQ